MSIAIHDRPGSFSDLWISYCSERGIPFRIVDCFRTDIMRQLGECEALMWHFHHARPRDIQFAKQLMYSVEAAGKVAFPDFRTMWHFNDKVGQKYLLEAVGAPLVPTYVFYDRAEANRWAGAASFPKVFKLRGGSASSNVHLVGDRRTALRLIRRSFGRGHSPYDRLGDLKERWRRYRLGRNDLANVAKGVVRLAVPPLIARLRGRDRGYAYFQDFIPDNDHDVRVVVIGDRAFALKRMVRAGDFRASGSKDVRYARSEFDEEMIRLAFDVHRRLEAQCLAFDFVSHEGLPLVLEMSYGFVTDGSHCEGYWDRSMRWHAGPPRPQAWMVDLVVDRILSRTDTKSPIPGSRDEWQNAHPITTSTLL